MVERNVTTKGEIARALKESSNTIKSLNKLYTKEQAKKAKNLERLKELKEKKKLEKKGKLPTKIKLDFREDVKKNENISSNTHKPKEKKKGSNKNIDKVRDIQDMDLKTLCGELNLDPGKARAKLRRNGINKPYSWSGDELEKVRNILK